MRKPIFKDHDPNAWYLKPVSKDFQKIGWFWLLGVGALIFVFMIYQNGIWQ